MQPTPKDPPLRKPKPKKGSWKKFWQIARPQLEQKLTETKIEGLTLTQELFIRINKIIYRAFHHEKGCSITKIFATNKILPQKAGGIVRREIMQILEQKEFAKVLQKEQEILEKRANKIKQAQQKPGSLYRFYTILAQRLKDSNITITEKQHTAISWKIRHVFSPNNNTIFARSFHTSDIINKELGNIIRKECLLILQHEEFAPILQKEQKNLKQQEKIANQRRQTQRKPGSPYRFYTILIQRLQNKDSNITITGKQKRMLESTIWDVFSPHKNRTFARCFHKSNVINKELGEIIRKECQLILQLKEFAHIGQREQEILGKRRQTQQKPRRSYRFYTILVQRLKDSNIAITKGQKKLIRKTIYLVFSPSNTRTFARCFHKGNTINKELGEIIRKECHLILQRDEFARMLQKEQRILKTRKLKTQQKNSFFITGGKRKRSDGQNAILDTEHKNKKLRF